MTYRLGNIVIIEEEPPRKCSQCGSMRECRPYGKGGAVVCYQCMMSTPETKAEAERQIAARLWNPS
jgi:hypothetical protein